MEPTHIQQGEQAVNRPLVSSVGSGIQAVRPKLAVVGRGVLGLLIFGIVLYFAAIAVGETVARIPGFLGAVALFTVGMLGIAAAPSVAKWMLSRVYEF